MTRTLRGDLALLACAAVWGLTFPLVGQALREGISPVLFVGLRFTLALVVLLPVAWWRGVRVGRRALRDGLLVGLFVLAGFVMQTLGLRTLPAARSAFLTSFYVLFTPLLSVLVLRRIPSRAVAVGLALAFAGGLVYTDAGGLGAGAGLGGDDLWTLASALAFAAQIVALSVMARRHGTFPLLLLQCGVAAAGGLIAAPLLESPSFEISRGSLFAVAFNGIVASALILGLQTWGQRWTSAPRAAVLFSSEPLWAAAFAWFLWGEGLGPREVVGGALILAGILWAELGAARAR